MSHTYDLNLGQSRLAIFCSQTYVLNHKASTNLCALTERFGLVLIPMCFVKEAWLSYYSYMCFANSFVVVIVSIYHTDRKH